MVFKFGNSEVKILLKTKLFYGVADSYGRSMRKGTLHTLLLGSLLQTPSELVTLLIDEVQTLPELVTLLIDEVQTLPELVTLLIDEVQTLPELVTLLIDEV